MKRKVYIVLGVIGVLLVIGFVGKFIKDASSYGTSGNTSDEKPVIYLYPEQEQEISVRLNYDGKLTCTYPEYDNGWNVTAAPDGTITDENGQEYNYLYWEGSSEQEYDFSEGFCVAGENTAEFLEDALVRLGPIQPEPDTVIRVFMAYKPLDHYQEIPEQSLSAPERSGFTVVEWGGSELP